MLFRNFLGSELRKLQQKKLNFRMSDSDFYAKIRSESIKKCEFICYKECRFCRFSGGVFLSRSWQKRYFGASNPHMWGIKLRYRHIWGLKIKVAKIVFLCVREAIDILFFYGNRSCFGNLPGEPLHNGARIYSHQPVEVR